MKYVVLMTFIFRYRDVQYVTQSYSLQFVSSRDGIWPGQSGSNLLLIALCYLPLEQSNSSKPIDLLFVLDKSKKLGAFYSHNLMQQFCNKF